MISRVFLLFFYFKFFPAPTVDREVIDVSLACIAKLEDKYYRLQIVSYDITEDCCEVKFLDYGGFGTFQVSDLLQIRSDFLTLPFQVICE